MSKLLPENQFRSFSSKYQIMYLTGFLIGPVLVSLLFKYQASFDGGLLLVDKYNGIAFILFWMFAALCLLMLCCVSDLNNYVIEEEEEEDEEEAEEVKVISENADNALFDDHVERLKRSKRYEAEYLQRKKHQQQQQRDKDEKNHPSRDQGDEGSSQSLLLAKFIMVFFMLLNFFSNSTEMIVVMVAVRKLNVTIAIFCALVVCCLFVFMVILSRLWRKIFDDNESKKFLSGVACIVISITANISIIFASQESFNKYLRIFFIFLTILLNSMCGFTASDSAQNIISVIIPPNNDIFKQISTWWIPIYRIFGITGLLLAGFLLKFTTVIYTIFVVLQVLFLGVLYKERNKFKTE